MDGQLFHAQPLESSNLSTETKEENGKVIGKQVGSTSKANIEKLISGK